MIKYERGDPSQEKKPGSYSLKKFAADILVAAVVAGSLAVGHDAYVIHRDNVTRIDALQEQIDEYNELRSGLRGMIDPEEDMRDSLMIMQGAGKAVAACQNEYMGIEQVSGTNGNDTDAIYQSLNEQMKALVTGEVGQWFYPGKAVRDNLTWRFEEIYEPDGTDCDGVWTLRDEEGLLLAVARGQWDEDSFVDVSVSVTDYGYKFTSAVMDAGDSAEPGYEEIMDEGGVLDEE